MTEFKSNTLIAEKIDGDNAIAINVKFTDSSFDINPENSELKSIIEDALTSLFIILRYTLYT